MVQLSRSQAVLCWRASGAKIVPVPCCVSFYVPYGILRTNYGGQLVSRCSLIHDAPGNPLDCRAEDNGPTAREQTSDIVQCYS